MFSRSKTWDPGQGRLARKKVEGLKNRYNYGYQKWYDYVPPKYKRIYDKMLKHMRKCLANLLDIKLLF